MLKNNIKHVVLFVVLISLTSCASRVYTLYEGGPSKSEIAVLVEGPEFEKDYSLNVFAVDGVKPSDATWNRHFYGSKLNGSYRIELLPGKRTITVKYRERTAGVLYLSPSQDVVINLEAGKTYILKASMDVNQKSFKVWAEEVID